MPDHVQGSISLGGKASSVLSSDYGIGCFAGLFLMDFMEQRSGYVALLVNINETPHGKAPLDKAQLSARLVIRHCMGLCDSRFTHPKKVLNGETWIVLVFVTST
jgi:hypothetical protein